MRVLLKFSGETLQGDKGFGYDVAACERVADDIRKLVDLGIEVAVVIGAGNIFRGAKAHNLERTPADHIGMLATIMNGITVREVLHQKGCAAHVMSAISCDSIVEKYCWQNAMNFLKSGSVVIFTGGTGNPFFTTDSAAALRACEINADIFLKTTKVDGVYDKDPIKYPDAKKYDTLSYEQALSEDLKVMDAAAIALCRDNDMPIRVFNFFKEDIVNVVSNNQSGTIIC
jgi:uridylate kinase